MKKILIVDDDKALLQVLSVGLKKSGYLVYTAVDTPTAIKQLVSENPDLLILDIMLPGGEGFLVAEKSNELPKNIPTIYMTVRDEPEYKRKAEALGAIAYFEKPFQFDKLLLTVKKALDT